MAPSVTMNVPYEPAPAPKKTNLQGDVQQLVKQKGSFHTVSEQQLLTDLSASTLSADVNVDDDDGGQDDATVTETDQVTREKLFRMREEIQQGIA